MSAPMDTRQLNAFVDGELGLPRQLEIEAELAHDARVRAEVEQLRGLREALREQADYHPAPAALRQRLQALVAVPAAPVATAPPVARRGWWTLRPWALSFALAALLAVGLDATLRSARDDERVVQEAVASHVRATLSDRVVDVASSDRHTVKPWLSSKLDFSPPVPELRLPALTFVGGRVDYLDGRPVAVLVYRQRAHLIDVFIAPSTEGDQRMRIASQRGFNVAQQVRSRARYWIVSDLNSAELRSFAAALDAADAADAAR